MHRSLSQKIFLTCIFIGWWCNDLFECLRAVRYRSIITCFHFFFLIILHTFLYIFPSIYIFKKYKQYYQTSPKKSLIIFQKSWGLPGRGYTFQKMLNFLFVFPCLMSDNNWGPLSFVCSCVMPTPIVDYDRPF